MIIIEWFEERKEKRKRREDTESKLRELSDRNDKARDILEETASRTITRWRHELIEDDDRTIPDYRDKGKRK